MKNVGYRYLTEDTFIVDEGNLIIGKIVLLINIEPYWNEDRYNYDNLHRVTYDGMVIDSTKPGLEFTSLGQFDEWDDAISVIFHAFEAQSIG